MRRDLEIDWARAAPQQLLPVFLSLFPAASVWPGREDTRLQRCVGFSFLLSLSRAPLKS